MDVKDDFSDTMIPTGTQGSITESYLDPLASAWTWMPRDPGLVWLGIP
ncbi:MAG: hypothetical protein NW237_04045 [Cyanobacteriota bacterium]|nr:hypothetical protein [Cyanobacteriota bacterium]